MEKVKVIKELPRRTYIQGQFLGKYRSYLDRSRSYSDIDRYYTLDVYESEIFHATLIKEENYTASSSFNENVIIRQPIKFCTTLQGEEKCFLIDLKEYQIEDVRLFDVINDSDQTLGSISGTIRGYIYDLARTETYEEYKEDSSINFAEATSYAEPVTDSSVRYTQAESTRNARWSGWNWFRNRHAQTGWGRQRSSRSWLLSAIFFLLSLFILKWIWPFLLIIGLFAGLRLLSGRRSSVGLFMNRSGSFLGRIFFSFMKLLGVLFWLFVIYALWQSCSKSAGNSGTSEENKLEKAHKKFAENDDPLPVKDDETPEQAKDVPQHHRRKTRHGHSKTSSTPDTDRISIAEDSLIIHKVSWEDYSARLYSGDVIVSRMNYEGARETRNSLTPQGTNGTDFWHSIYKKLEINNRDKLHYVYKMLDDIRVENDLSAREFADVIVSCVQHIPYVLVLNDDCNPDLYDQAFIKDYLTHDQSCQCCVRFGLYAPTEFCGNLKGDCDTRTLLLYTILGHFGYDAVIMNSDVYHHSIIGLNIPSNGVYKTYNNKKYYAWETTARGFELGQLPASISNMQLWNVIMTSKNF